MFAKDETLVVETKVSAFGGRVMVYLRRKSDGGSRNWINALPGKQLIIFHGNSLMTKMHYVRVSYQRENLFPKNHYISKFVIKKKLGTTLSYVVMEKCAENFEWTQWKLLELSSAGSKERKTNAKFCVASRSVRKWKNQELHILCH